MLRGCDALLQCWREGRVDVADVDTPDSVLESDPWGSVYTI